MMTASLPDCQLITVCKLFCGPFCLERAFTLTDLQSINNDELQ